MFFVSYISLYFLLHLIYTSPWTYCYYRLSGNAFIRAKHGSFSGLVAPVSETRRTRDGLGALEVVLMLVRWLESAFGLSPDFEKDESNRPGLALVRSDLPNFRIIAVFRRAILSELPQYQIVATHTIANNQHT
jgi:hypothetical protein